MKQSNVARLLALTMSLELIVGPILESAQAQTRTTPSTGITPTVRPEKTGDETAEMISAGIQGVGKIWGQVMGAQGQNQMSPQMTGDMAKLQEQQQPQPDKYFNPQKLMQIPGLANYLALNNINPMALDCKSLPTTLFDARPEVCRPSAGITTDKGNQQMQLQQAFTYYNQYFQINKLYKNYSADSNAEGQAFGIGCMNNAMNILNGFFKYRLDELDKLVTNIEALQNQFREQSKADLDALEEAVGVLDGGAPLADKARKRKPELFKFDQVFNNPSCNSMFAGNKLNELGRAGGLNQINSNITDLMNSPGKYNGANYTKQHASVMEDLSSLADKVSKQLELNFASISQNPQSYQNFLSDLPGAVSSTSGANNALTKDMFSDVQTKFNESIIKLEQQKGTIISELSSAGIQPEAATRLLGNANSPNFENEVYTIENRLKNKCFDSTLSAMGKDTLLSKIYDPSASSHANKFASNFLKDKLNQIINDPDSSLDKKLSQLKQLESETGSRYYMKMDNSYEVQDVDDQGNLKPPRIVGASTVRTPSVFFSDLIQNCNAQFKANKLNNKLSGASAIQKLRDLNRDYKTLAKEQASDIRKEVRKKLIECKTPEDANNSMAGSCTPERFNTSSPNFCANAAFSCSKNMQACSEKAKGIVTKIQKEKEDRTKNYNSMLQKNKRDMVKIFDSALARYMQDGEKIRGLFGAGFSSPAGILREVPEGGLNGKPKFLAEFSQATARSQDGVLQLDNPEAYTEMLKANVAQLKNSVKQQQDQILGGDSTGKGAQTPGLLAEHIRKTQKNYKDVVEESNQVAQNCISIHDNMVKASNDAAAKAQEDYNKKMSELGEKRSEWCNRYAMAQDNPIGACNGIQQISTDALKAANSADGRAAIGKFAQVCQSYNNQNTSSGGGSSDNSMEYTKACRDAGYEFGSETKGTVKAPLDASTGAQIWNMCKKVYDDQKACEARPVAEGKAAPNCSSTDGRNSVVLTYREATNSSRAGGALTVASIASEAGAYCNGSSNSSSRMTKMVDALSNGLAAGGIGAKGM